MSSHLVFNEVAAAVKARLESYWAEKLPRLKKLLTNYREDLQEIRLTVSRHPQSPRREWYEVRGVIHLPTGTLAAEADDKVPEAAIDRVADDLAREIKRHKELLRHDYLYKRKRRDRDALKASGVMLQRDVEGKRRPDFFRLLRPQLRFLRDYARRELSILEKNQLLHRGETTVDDLLDEVVTLAWERFANRPRKMPLDLWLTDLVHEVLERWIKEEPRPHVSLEEKAEKVVPDKVPHPDEQEWWTDLTPFEEETFRLEDLIPDAKEREPADELEAEELRNRVTSLLGELPAKQRQAFLLYALEDHNTAEIAILQDRPESEVKADIEAARQWLRERLSAETSTQEEGKSAVASAAR